MAKKKVQFPADTFPAVVRKARLAKPLGLRELTRILKYKASSYIVKIERGEVSTPKVVRQLSKHLGVSIYRLELAVLNLKIYRLTQKAGLPYRGYPLTDLPPEEITATDFQI